jgi:hypothetical protein
MSNEHFTVLAILTSLSELANKMAELQTEHGKLVARLEAEQDNKSSLLQKGEFCVFSGGTAGFYGYEGDATNNSNNSFQDQTTADKYAKAFSTMLALRHCKGSVKAVNDVNQYYITNGGGIDSYESLVYKDGISCYFETQQDAQNAVETVGKQNIIDMYATLNGSGL